MGRGGRIVLGNSLPGYRNRSISPGTTFTSLHRNSKKEPSMKTATTLVIPLFLFAMVLGHAQTYPNTPIQHVIVVIQENRTPDNLFGADAPLIARGAHLASSGSCQGASVTLTASPLGACFDPSHEHEAWVSSFDDAAMDRACTTPTGIKKGCTSPVMYGERQETAVPAVYVRAQRAVRRRP